MSAVHRSVYRRLPGLVLALGVLATACAADTPLASDSHSEIPEMAGGAPEPAVVSTTLPAAPDFLMELADGSTFVLSRQDKPVYMVFWAEW
ncbi:MAG: hypothetical protein ACE5GC_08995 [Acidimicrobiia bacterium]